MEDEIKTILSSLIVSCPSGITVNKLRFDFKEITGTEVPYRKLGFSNFVDYLHSIPATCRLNGHSDQAIVLPVINEQNKHINDMILKQRPPRSTNRRFKPVKRSRGVSDFGSSKPRSLLQPVNFNFNVPITNPDSHLKKLPPPVDYFMDERGKYSSRHPPPALFRPPPQPLFRQPPQPLFRQPPQPLFRQPPEHFRQTRAQNTSYYSHYDNRITGYNLIQQTANSYRGPASNYYPGQTLNNNIKPSSSTYEADAANPFKGQALNSSEQSPNSFKEQTSNSCKEPTSNSGKESTSNSYREPAANSFKKIEPTPNSVNEHSSKSYKEETSNVYREEASNSKNSKAISHTEPASNLHAESSIESNREEASSINYGAADKVPYNANFAQPYDSDSDYDELLDLENFDYQSDDEELDLNTCAANLQRVSLHDEFYPKVKTPICEEAPQHESKVHPRVKEKLKTLISDHEDGIWCSKLLKLYLDRFGQRLDPLDYGFCSVIELCDDLPDVFYCIRPNRLDWKLYDVRKPIPDIHSIRDISKYLQTMPRVSEERRNTESALPDNIEEIVPSFKYPDDVVQPDEKINTQWLLNDEGVNDYIEIIISEVYDPSKFWVQLRSPETTEALESLMDEIQYYYMVNAHTYQLNEFSVRIGLLCVALFMNEYHRAVIIKVFNDDTIQVYYIDYGTVAEVSLRKTCFLHRKFSYLPQQAIRARLYNIVPVEQNTMWRREASLHMLNLVMEKPLVGLISNMNADEKILELIVSDTNSPDIDIHINDELVSAGYAVVGNEAPLCSSSYATIANVHLYPSFTEIEHAIYPTFADIGKLLKLGQMYETIFHGYFSIGVDSFTTPDSLRQTDSRCSSRFDYPMSQGQYFSESEQDNSQEIKEQSSTQDVMHIAEESNSQHSSHEETSISASNDEQIEIESHLDRDDISTEEVQQAEEINEEMPTDRTYYPPSVHHLRQSIPPPPGFNQDQTQINVTNFFNSFLPGINTAANSCSLVVPNQQYPPYPSYLACLTNPLFLQQVYMQQQTTMLQQQQIRLQIEQYQQSIEFGRLQKMANFPAAYPPSGSSNFNTPSHMAQTNVNLNNQYSSAQTSSIGTNTCSQVADLSNIKESSIQSNFNDIHEHASQNKHDTLLSNSTTLTETVSEPRQEITANNQEPGFQNMYDKFLSKSSESVQVVDASRSEGETPDILTNITEHICNRAVLELEIGDVILHVLKINNKPYVVSQELLKNIFHINVTVKKWMKYNKLDYNSFPNDLIDISKHEELYEQLKRYSVPGIPKANNLGCNIRVTPLADVPRILKSQGFSETSDLDSSIKKLELQSRATSSILHSFD